MMDMIFTLELAGLVALCARIILGRVAGKAALDALEGWYKDPSFYRFVREVFVCLLIIELVLR